MKPRHAPDCDESYLKFASDGGGGRAAYFYPALSGPSYGQIHSATTSLDGNGRTVTLPSDNRKPLMPSAVGEVQTAEVRGSNSATQAKRVKFLCCCCCVLAAGLIAISGFLLLSYLPAFRPPPRQPPASELGGGVRQSVGDDNSASSGSARCLGYACLKAAAEMEESLNRSAEPCRAGGDFYNFACGGWLAENHLPPAAPVWSRQEKLQSAIRGHLQEMLEESGEDSNWEVKLKTFYKACATMEDPRASQCHAAGGGAAGGIDDGADSFQALLKHCQNKGMRRLSDRIICMQVDQGVGALLQLSVVASPWRSGSQILLLDEFSEPELQEAATAANPDDRAELLQLVATMVDDLGHLGKSVGWNYADSVLTVLNELTEISLPANHEFKTQPQLRAVNLTVSELRQLLDGSLIQYDELIAYFLHGNQEAKVDEVTVAVGNLNYLQSLGYLMKRLRDDDLRKFLEFCVIYKFAPFYSAPSRRHLQAYRARRLGQELAEEFWLPCLRLLTGPGLNAAYHKELGHRLRLELISSTIVPYLKKAFVNIARNRSNLNPQVIEKISDKINKMRFLIGFSKTQMTEDFLNRYFSEWNVSPSSSVLSMVVNLTSLLQRRLRQSIDMDSQSILEETVDITTVYPSYRYAENTVVLPAAFLQWPFHLANNMMPFYLKFGFIGTALATEMVKSTDTIGSNWDANGLKADQKLSILTQEDENCLKHKLLQLLPGQTESRRAPMNSAAASILGLQVAAEAYRLHSADSGRQLSLPTVGYSPTQALFLAFAQAHCGVERPALLERRADKYLNLRNRVHLALQHSSLFHRSFHCPAMSNARNCLHNN